MNNKKTETTWANVRDDNPDEGHTVLGLYEDQSVCSVYRIGEYWYEDGGEFGEVNEPLYWAELPKIPEAVREDAGWSVIIRRSNVLKNLYIWELRRGRTMVLLSHTHYKSIETALTDVHAVRKAFTSGNVGIREEL